VPAGCRPLPPRETISLVRPDRLVAGLFLKYPLLRERYPFLSQQLHTSMGDPLCRRAHTCRPNSSATPGSRDAPAVGRSLLPPAQLELLQPLYQTPTLQTPCLLRHATFPFLGSAPTGWPHTRRHGDPRREHAREEREPPSGEALERARGHQGCERQHLLPLWRCSGHHRRGAAGRGPEERSLVRALREPAGRY